MRRAMLAVFSVCALAACNPSTPAGQSAESGAGGAFPDMSASAYRAEVTINGDRGAVPLVLMRDGRSFRMEFATGDGPSTFISNAATGESYILTEQSGRTMAIRASGLNDAIPNPTEEWQGDALQSATRTGDCSVAGENGAEWTRTTAETGTDTVCVTEDGIMLRITDDGRVAWETTSVQRGPQSAELFTLPAGVQVMDLGNVEAMMNQAIEAAKQRGN